MSYNRKVSWNDRFPNLWPDRACNWLDWGYVLFHVAVPQTLNVRCVASDDPQLFSFINMVVTSGEKRGRHTKKGPGLACASAWVTCKIDRLVGCDGKSCRRLPENMAGASMEPWPLRWWSYLPIALVRSAHKIIKQQPSGQSWSFRELIPSPVKSLLKKSCLNPRKI